MRVPQNSAEVTEAIAPTLDLFINQSEAAIKRATDEIYERLLYAVQDYLKDNAEWNLGAEIDRCRTIEAVNRELRASQAELLEALERGLEWFGPMLNDTPQDRVVAAQMRAAIAKARGAP